MFDAIPVPVVGVHDKLHLPAAEWAFGEIWDGRHSSFSQWSPFALCPAHRGFNPMRDLDADKGVAFGFVQFREVEIFGISFD